MFQNIQMYSSDTLKDKMTQILTIDAHAANRQIVWYIFHRKVGSLHFEQKESFAMTSSACPEIHSLECTEAADASTSRDKLKVDIGIIKLYVF